MLKNYLNDIRKRGQWSFTLKQVMDDLSISKSATLTALHRLKKKGEIISPLRGFYVIVPPEYQIIGSIPAQDLVPLIMDHLQAGYYVSLLSGAMYHGASHQKPMVFQVISDRHFRKPLVFGRVVIEFLYKKNLYDLPTQDVVVNTGYLKVASPELVAYDLFVYPAKSGGLNHIATVLSELVEAMDEKRLLELADFLQKKSWLQRMGYILSHIDPFDQKKSKRIVAALRRYLKTKKLTYVPLASELSKKGYPRDKEWKIIVNTNVESDI